MNINHIQVGATNILKAYLGNTIIYQKVIGLVSLFSGGKQGFWYDASDLSTLYQDSAGTVATKLAGDPIALVKDKSGNNKNAKQTVSTKRSIYNTNPSRITLDKVDDEFIVIVPTGGWIGTMVVGTTIGTASYEVNLPPGNFLLGKPASKFDRNIVGVVLRNGSLTEAEKTSIKDYFIGKGAVDSYTTITNYTDFWNSRSEITDFPLIDTSSATIFYRAWWSCKKLTSFPLINTSAGTNFQQAWDNCSGLTSFPLIDTAAGTNFNFAWYSCTGLTSFPLINTSAGISFNNAWQNCSGLTSFPLLNTVAGTNFSNAWNGCIGLTSFPLIDTSAGTNFSLAWSGCTGLISFPLINTSAATSFNQVWQNCSALTSFPLVDTAAGTSVQYAWYGCTSLTSFPLINTLKCTSFGFAWYGCIGLTSFPLIDTAAGISFTNTWYGCTSLTSFPLINTSAGTNFSNAWNGCTSLSDIPANMFDFIKGGNFTNAFLNTALTQVSIDNILTSLVTSGIAAGTRVFNQSGGSAPSITGTNAIDTLRLRGWTVTVTGGY